MTMKRTLTCLAIIASALIIKTPAQAQQVRLVNVIPNSLSAETNRDAEPNIAVNPADPTQIVISAFTPDPGASANVPLFISNTNGTSWALSAAIIAGTTGYCVAPI